MEPFGDDCPRSCRRLPFARMRHLRLLTDTDMCDNERCATWNLTLQGVGGERFGIHRFSTVSGIRSISAYRAEPATDSDPLAQLIVDMQPIIQWRVYVHCEPEARSPQTRLPTLDFLSSQTCALEVMEIGTRLFHSNTLSSKKPGFPRAHRPRLRWVWLQTVYGTTYLGDHVHVDSAVRNLSFLVAPAKGFISLGRSTMVRSSQASISNMFPNLEPLQSDVKSSRLSPTSITLSSESALASAAPGLENENPRSGARHWPVELGLRGSTIRIRKWTNSDYRLLQMWVPRLGFNSFGSPSDSRVTSFREDESNLRRGCR